MLLLSRTSPISGIDQAAPSAMTLTRHQRGTLVLFATFSLYWLATLRLDMEASAWQQALLGFNTWLFLVIALKLSTPAERTQTIAMVLVATAVECLCSIIWGLYRYRLENLPMYVPPGHGLFFLMALRMADLPWIKHSARVLVTAVLVGAIGLVLRGLFVLPVPDLFGFGSWVVLLCFLLAGRYPLFYAMTFALTMVLEFYGTSLGTWTWQAQVPYLGIPCGNPPAAIGVGYCIMDNLARRLAPHLTRAWSQVLAFRWNRSPRLWTTPAAAPVATQPSTESGS
jgi:hypothetical protein